MTEWAKYFAICVSTACTCKRIIIRSVYYIQNKKIRCRCEEWRGMEIIKSLCDPVWWKALASYGYRCNAMLVFFCFKQMNSFTSFKVCVTIGLLYHWLWYWSVVTVNALTKNLFSHHSLWLNLRKCIRRTCIAILFLYTFDSACLAHCLHQYTPSWKLTI